jgi:hypothetical protein
VRTQTSPEPCQVAVIVVESERLISASSRMKIDHPHYLPIVARGLELDAQLLTMAASVITDLAM